MSAPVQRFVTLRGAVGKARWAKSMGRDVLVVPVVALVEGVIHPVNAPHPELVRAERFEPSLREWSDGQPLYAGHPVKDGTPVDGHLADVLPTSFGRTANARVSGKRLEMDAVIDPALCADGKNAAILKRAEAGDVIEVSVGVYVAMGEAEGEWEGRKFRGEWLEMRPNHLALLDEGQRGACSVAMGCGAMRANASGALEPDPLDGSAFRSLWPDSSGHDDHGREPAQQAAYAHVLTHVSPHGMPTFHDKQFADYMAEEPAGVTKLSKEQVFSKYKEYAKLRDSKAAKGGKMKGLIGRISRAFRDAMPSGWSDVDVKQEIREALLAVEPGMANGDVVAVYEDSVVYCLWPTPSGGMYSPVGANVTTFWRRPYTFTNGDKEVELGDRVEVEPVMSYEAAGEAPKDEDGIGKRTETPCGCGARHAENQPAATEETDMKREERVAALIANPHCIVKSPKALAEASDLELTALEDNAKTLKAAADKATSDKAAADLKAAAEAGKPKELTEAEFLATAPASIKAAVEYAQVMKTAQDAADATERTTLVGKLKTACAGAWTEEELTKQELPMLRGLAKALKVAEPAVVADFSALAIPVDPAQLRDAAGKHLYAPPDPYAEALKARAN